MTETTMWAATNRRGKIMEIADRKQDCGDYGGKIIKVVVGWAESMWMPVESLPDSADTTIVLWNPCDGVHLLDTTLGAAEMENIRTEGVYTHWRKLSAP